MAELSQVDLNRYSCSMPAGLCANGSPYPVDLAKSHGLIVAGGSGEARLKTVRAMVAAARHEGGVEAVLCGAGDPAEGQEAVALEAAEDRLQAFCDEQIRRYDAMKQAGSNNLPHYNACAASRGLEPFPFKFFVIGELQDCVGRFGRKFIDRLCFAARYGRACGMLPVVCAESAEPEKLPALLKAEIADRVCLGVKTRRDSLSLLGALGGESLGEGDVLYRHVAEKTEPVRLRAAAA